jgi:glycosyltransferase involved in cell wall biosynthesis
VLGSSGAHDLSARVLKAKRRHWRGLRFELISPSRWLAERVRTSVLFATHPCTILPQATDTRVFRPVPMEQARTLLGLDPEALVVAFGAINFDTPRKGFALAQAAIASLQPAGRLERMVFCLFGNSSQRVPARIGQIPVRHLGRLEDELSVALVFSAADAALVPSLQDTGPQITAEALACGTPVIGFPVGVTADLVRHGVNGFLAPPFEAAGLAAGLQWAADHRGDPAVRAAAREAAVQQADIRLQLPRYLEIYDRALRGEKPTAE